MKKRFMQLMLNIFLTLSLMISCVGTVEEKNPTRSKGALSGLGVIPYDGIISAVGVANDKIEIYFSVSEGNPSDIIYLITSNASESVLAYKGNILQQGYGSEYRVLIDGLEMDKIYTFTVQAKNTSTLAESVSRESQTAKTLSGYVSDTRGITSVQNLPGEEGKNSITVTWNKVINKTPKSIPIPKIPTDVKKYQVVLINPAITGLAPTIVNFNDENKTETDGRIVVDIYDSLNVGRPNERSYAQVNGLIPNTLYYVRVRAIQMGVNWEGSDLHEQNNKVLEITTLSDNLADITFNPGSFQVNTSEGVAGKNSFDLKWDPAIGAFSHYRVYYKEYVSAADWPGLRAAIPPICDPLIPASGFTCKEVRYSDFTTVITGLTSFKEQEVHLLICTDYVCGTGSFVEYNSGSGTYWTNPNEIFFSGVTEVRNPQDYRALDEVTLLYDPIDFSQGIMDGIKVRMTLPDGTSCILNDPTPPNNYGQVPGPGCDDQRFDAVYVNSFDIKLLTDGIKVRGLDLSTSPSYAFTLIPYILRDSIFEEYSYQVPGALTQVGLVTPRFSVDYTSVKTIGKDASTLALKPLWDAPSAGLFDSYRVFMREYIAGVSTVLADICPITNSNDYGESYGFVNIELPPNVTTVSFGSLVGGKKYEIFVIPYLSSTDSYAECSGNTGKQEGL